MSLPDKLSLSLDAIIAQSSRSGGGRGLSRGFPVRAEAEGAPAAQETGTRAPTGERETRRVFVNNLSYDTNWQGLKDHFKAVGNVTFADVKTEGSGPGARSKGCGIVEFESSGDAANAIQQLNESNLDGRAILVREDRGAFVPDGREGGALSQQRQRRAPSSGYGDRSYGGDRREASSYGGDRRERNFDRREGGYERRDGSARERSPPPAPSDMECYECGDLGHRARDCPQRAEGGSYRRAPGRDAAAGGAGRSFPPRAGRQIVVHGLPYSFTWQDLKDLANETGGAVKADISTDRQSGRSRGFGTVLFETQEEAQAAITALSGSDMDGRYLTAKLDEYVD